MLNILIVEFVCSTIAVVVCGMMIFGEPTIKGSSKECASIIKTLEVEQYRWNNIYVKLVDNKDFEWEHALKMLNQKDTEGLVEIDFYYDFVGIDLGAKNFCRYGSTEYDEVRGLYNVNERSISLYTYKDYTEVLNHELGHHIWYYSLTKKIRKEWIAAFEKQEDFLSTNSKIDYEENFAEEYAYYQRDPKLLWPDKKELMEKILHDTRQ